MLLRSLIQAFSTYSAIPAPETKWDEDSMKYALAFFPLVGAVIGAAEYGAYLLLVYLNSGALLTAAVLTALPLLLTGGIHMDGFLDACDALHSWRDREEKLRIMKDPHAGAFAVISCGIYLILYLGGASEAGLLEMRVFCASFGLTRALSAAAALTIPKARTGGMLRAETDASDKKALYAVLPEGLLFAALMLLADPARGGAALGAAAAAFCFYRRTALRTFGGTTGDLAGWFVQLAELAVLLTAVCCGLLL